MIIGVISFTTFPTKIQGPRRLGMAINMTSQKSTEYFKSVFPNRHHPTYTKSHQISIKMVKRVLGLEKEEKI